jgi:hypothetical protein
LTRILNKDMPTIITASWYTPLPPEVARVSISRGPPRGHRGYRKLPFLAPGRWFRSVDEVEYVRRYAEQLSHVDPSYVYQRLVGCAEGASTIAMCCFERPGTSDGWCHRALTASWLSDAIGADIPEFGYEHLAQDEHPMLPRCRRRDQID